MGICEADGDLEGTGDDAKGVQEVFFAPDAGAAVDEIGEYAAGGSEDDVEQTEHGGPAAGTSLAERFEVFEIVGAEDGIDGELGTEGTEVAAGCDERLQAEDYGGGFFEAGFADDFSACSVKHLLFADLSFAVGDVARFGVKDHVFLVALGGVAVGGGSGVFVPKCSWDFNDVAGDAVAG